MTGLRGRAGIAGGALIIAALGGFAIPAATTTAPALAATTPAQGVDVASFQHPSGAAIDWSSMASSGVTFTGVKASEGKYYTNPYYKTDTAQAVAAGLYVTPYIFANPYPSTSDGTAVQQADYGATVIKSSTAYTNNHMLPVTLDIEPNPYTNSNQCYGLTQSAMQTWISQFMTEIKKDLGTSKTPIVYTTADWWNACTGNDTAFSADPLWLASYGVTNPGLPAGWNNYTIWQYGQGTVGGISGIDENELGPVLQVARAGTAIGTVRLRTLNSLAGQAVTYSATGLPPGLTLIGRPDHRDARGGRHRPPVHSDGHPVGRRGPFVDLVHLDHPRRAYRDQPGEPHDHGRDAGLAAGRRQRPGRRQLPANNHRVRAAPGDGDQQVRGDHRLADHARHVHGACLRVRRVVRVRLDDLHVDDRRSC